MPQWYMYNVVKRQIGEDVLVMFRSGAGVSRRVVIHCRALLVHDDDGGGGGRMSSRSQQKSLAHSRLLKLVGKHTFCYCT